MSRSPLFASMRRCLRLARQGEAPELPQPSGMTRRSLLRQGVALLAGSLLTAGCARSSGPPRRIDTAIIGAGLAGLACAWTLSRQGFSASVFEASQRLGGRVLSDRTSFPPAACELGGEFINSDHSTMLRLAHELDIPLIDLHSDPLRCDAFLARIAQRTWSHAELVEPFRPPGRLRSSTAT